MSVHAEKPYGDLSVSQIFVEFIRFSAICLICKIKLMLRRLVSFRPSAAGTDTDNKNVSRSRSELKGLIESEAPLLKDIDQKLLISIVIPTYNEEATIEGTIDSVFGSIDNYEDYVEVIISDGGSTDTTISICQNYLNSKRSKSRFVITSGGSNRSQSQNIGALESKGDVILFLHADSILPTNWIQLVWSAMTAQENLAGCFEFQLFLSDECYHLGKSLNTPNAATMANGIGSEKEKKQGNSAILLNYYRRLCICAIETGTNFRSRYLKLPYGDQALFFRRSIFLDCFHGFPSTQFMEDYDLMREVRKYGNVVTVGAPVRTSARRWEKNGFIWNTFLNQIIIYGHFIGVPHSRLVVWYYGLSKKKQY